MTGQQRGMSQVKPMQLDRRVLSSGTKAGRGEWMQQLGQMDAVGG